MNIQYAPQRQIRQELCLFMHVVFVLFNLTGIIRSDPNMSGTL